MTRGLFVLLVALTFLATSDLLGAAAAPIPVTSELLIDTQQGDQLLFQVELAVTPQEQALGLMFRESLAPDAGMLFVIDPVQPVAVWMKNTLVPLDILFIGADQGIVNIAANTTPLSLEPLFSAAPVLGVLEINAGLSGKLGIAAGDLVIHPALGIEPEPEPVQVPEPATLLLINVGLVAVFRTRRHVWRR